MHCLPCFHPDFTENPSGGLLRGPDIRPLESGFWPQAEEVVDPCQLKWSRGEHGRWRGVSQRLGSGDQQPPPPYLLKILWAMTAWLYLRHLGPPNSLFFIKNIIFMPQFGLWVLWAMFRAEKTMFRPQATSARLLGFLGKIMYGTHM